MTDLHAAIMNLPCKYEAAWQTPAPSDWIEGYVNGHRDTRHAAAELAAADATAKAELLEALKKTREFVDTVHDGEYGYSECTRDELVEKLDAIIAKHGA